MQSPIDTDLAWAAGLFEGEGFITRRPTGNRVYIGVGIEMRDLDIVTRFVDVLRHNGVTITSRTNGPQDESQIRLRPRHAQNPKHSDVYVWTTTGHTARTAYELLRPWLGQRRRAKGDTIIAELTAINEQLDTPRTCTECGQPFSLKPYGRARLYCSSLCYSRAKIKRPGQREAARARQRRYQARQKARTCATSAPSGTINTAPAKASE